MDNRQSQAKVSRPSIGSTQAFRNPYLNFLQDFRKKNRGLTPKGVICKAAEMWKKMSDDQKTPYYELARSAPRRRKRKGRKGGRRKRRRSGSRRSRSHSRKRSMSRSADY